LIVARPALRRTVLLALLIPVPADAQRRAEARVGAQVPTVRELGPGGPPPPRHFAPGASAAAGDPAWWTPLASAVVPGAGQALLDQDRFVVYAAVEGIGWLRYIAERREGARQRGAYRELANRVARAFFTIDPQAGNFEYYERMQHYAESGVFDVDPGTPELEPEVDTLTYNGSLWLLARRTFWEHPDTLPPPGSEALGRAAAFYLERAIRPEFRWSWRNAQLEHDLFRRTIDESNEAYRQAIQALGVILANHVLSTVDAYVTLRLWSRESTTRSVGLSVQLPWAPLGRRGGTGPAP
jgi:hypothetical protein